MYFSYVNKLKFIRGVLLRIFNNETDNKKKIIDLSAYHAIIITNKYYRL